MENSKKIQSFTDLECWKSCRVVRNRFSGIIRKLPVEEKYALADGMRRASRSITENIAEGYGRYHFQENIQFCRISRGSLFELKDQLITAFDEKYLDAGEVKQVNILMDKALSLLNGYINYLAKAKISNNSKNQNLVREPNVSYISDNSKLANENNDLSEPPIS
jgi:four helix bundle protein